MIQIILDSEQEKLLNEQLKTGKYKTANEVITDALKILAERQRITVLSGESTQKLLDDKIRTIKELKQNYQPDPYRQKLAEEFSQLCEESQELHTNNPVNDAEIDEEIAAYRRGE